MVVTCFCFIIRCDEDECEREVEALKKLKEKQDHGLTMTEAVKNLSKSEIRTPFLLVFSYLLLAMYSGPNVIIFFAVEIFEDVGVYYYFKQFEQNPALKILPLIFVPCYMFSYGAGKVLLK